MKVGVLQFFSWPERRVPLPAVYDRAHRLTYHSEFWTFDNVEVLPKPYQRPQPPM